MYLFGCIIAGESPSIEWSSCTKEIWQQNLEANVGKCMENLPESLHDDAMTCGNFFIDEDVLAEAGVTDFEKYAVNPELELMPDFFV